MSSWSARWRRSVVPLAAAAAGAALLLPPGAGAGPDEEFIAGSGRARASLFEVAPRTGGLTIPVNFGRALATYRGTVAETSSIAVKPPSEPPAAPSGRTRPAAECGDAAPGDPGGSGGGPGFSFPFASEIAVGSDEEGSAAGREASFASTPAGSPVEAALQHQRVRADRQGPFGEAATTSGRLRLADLVELAGGRAEARSGVVDGRSRLAHAVVTLARVTLLGGAVVLEDLRWEALQRTGEGEAAEGGFDVGRVTVAGTPLPTPPAGAEPLAALNDALATTGLAVEAPRLDAEGNTVRVSPLTVRMADSSTGRDVLGPVLAGLQPVRDPLVDALLAASCDFGMAITVADVVLGVASGSGGISFDVGGVSATTEGTRFDNPFAGPVGGFPGLEAGPPADGPPSVPAAPLPATPATTAADLPVPDGRVPGGYATTVPGYGVADPAPGAGTHADPGEAAAPVAEGFEPAVAPGTRRLPGTRGGTALAIGVLGLAAVLAVAGADALRMRRAARSFPS